MSYPILSNAFKQAVVGTYSNTDTVIELASISNTVGNADFLPDPASGEYNVILYDTLFGNPADANNGGSYEIMRVTSINYGDNEITVTRGQENSTAITITDRPFAVLYGATSKFFTDLLLDVDGKEPADPTILKEADVIDNLTSTDTDKPLSANQGKVLEDGKEPADATILKQSDIVDNLTSTSTTAPLSANQGKTLQDTKVAKAGDTMTGLLRATAGINFNASGGDTLSDYEIGTWTPVYVPASGEFGSVTYAAQEGNYARIGRFVMIRGILRTNQISIGTASGILKITGIPFADSNNAPVVIGQAFSFSENFLRGLLGSSEILFFSSNLNAPQTLVTVSALDYTGSNKNFLQFSATYLTP
jgi:hypothetical protein